MTDGSSSSTIVDLITSTSSGRLCSAGAADADEATSALKVDRAGQSSVQDASVVFAERSSGFAVSGFVASSSSFGLGDALVVDASERGRALSVGGAGFRDGQEAGRALADRRSKVAIRGFIARSLVG